MSNAAFHKEKKVDATLAAWSHIILIELSEMREELKKSGVMPVEDDKGKKVFEILIQGGAGKRFLLPRLGILYHIRRSDAFHCIRYLHKKGRIKFNRKTSTVLLPAEDAEDEHTKPV